MQRDPEAFWLDRQFEVRLVTAYVLWFLPVFTALLLVFWRIHSSMFWLFAAKYAFFLALSGWMGWRRIGRERRQIEQCVEEDMMFFESKSLGKPKNLLYVIGAAATIGLLTVVARQDVRWLIVCAWLAFFLSMGEILRWLVYERWVSVNLRRLELRVEPGA